MKNLKNNCDLCFTLCKVFVYSLRMSNVLHIVKLDSGFNCAATIEGLQELANSNEINLEVFKSRRGNFQLIKLNGNLVAYGFNTQEQAIAYALTGDPT
jgi:hypothetical protein